MNVIHCFFFGRIRGKYGYFGHDVLAAKNQFYPMLAHNLEFKYMT